MLHAALSVYIYPLLYIIRCGKLSEQLHQYAVGDKPMSFRNGKASISVDHMPMIHIPYSLCKQILLRTVTETLCKLIDIQSLDSAQTQQHIFIGPLVRIHIFHIKSAGRVVKILFE